MEDQIKKSAPPSNLAESILDRITNVRVQASTPNTDWYAIEVTDEARRCFPIIVGQREGHALQEALGQRPPAPQPLLYDTVLAAARTFSMTLQAVRITELKEHTFFACLDFATPAGQASLDARPSDAINLAVRAGLPMQVVRAVTDRSLAWPVNWKDRIGDLRRKASADPADFAAGLDLARTLVEAHVHRAVYWSSSVSLEEMIQQAVRDLAEARALLAGIIRDSQDPAQRRDAALWLGNVECLEGRWAEAVAAFEKHDGSWPDAAWALALSAATALYRLDRHQEAFARLADAVAAIDRMHGTEPVAAARLIARQNLAWAAANNMPILAMQPRFREMFEPIDPPCLVVSWQEAPPFKFGPAFVLQDRPLVIGSAVEADIQLSGQKVSPRHARVFRDAEGWKVEDLESEAGTFVHEKRVEQPVPLKEGCQILLGTRPGAVALRFLNMAEQLPTTAPDTQPAPVYTYLSDEQPWSFPLPLADAFRRRAAKAPRTAPTVLDLAARHADSTLPAGQSPPDCPGWLAPWLVRKVRFAMDGESAELTLTGQDRQQAVLKGPAYRYGTAGQFLAGRSFDRPMTEQLAAKILAAGEVTCTDVVIGPPDASGQRAAQLHLCQGTRDAWFDADAIDAIATAAIMSPVPTVWVCDPSGPRA